MSGFIWRGTLPVICAVLAARGLFWLCSEDVEQLRPHVQGSATPIESSCHLDRRDPLPACEADSNLSKLATRGFAVLPHFLSEDEIQAMRELYYSKGWAGNTNYGTKMVDESEVPAGIYSKLLSMVRQIAVETDLKVDMPLPRSLYFIVNSSDMQHSFGIPWHQDTESFLLAESHYHYVNLYMPVEKSSKRDGNIHVVPYDTLRNCSPMLYELSRGKGAVDFFDCQGMSSQECQKNFGGGQDMSDAGLTRLPPETTMLRLDNNHASVHAIGFHLDSLACAPQLEPGDLLAFRGDMIHKTGAFTAPRLAWSVRVVSATDTVSIDRLLYGGIHKMVTINGNIGSYATRMGTIRAKGLREMSFSELAETRGCARQGGFCPLSTSERVMSHAWTLWYTAVFRWRWLRYETLTGLKIEA